MSIKEKEEEIYVGKVMCRRIRCLQTHDIFYLAIGIIPISPILDFIILSPFKT